MKYDVVIIGSGLGGLQCAYILSREGFNVCLLEKNKQLGGSLQTFKRSNTLFDTGMHYIGSMDEGQVLNRFFRYFGLTGKLNLKRMDENGYERILYDGKEYRFAMGYDNFLETLLPSFPNEKEALVKYTNQMKEISSSVDLYNMRELTDQPTRYLSYYSTGIHDFLASITNDPTLRSVLAGTSPLYAGVKERTPMYIPLIIHSSYIESAYRFLDGGSQISDILEKYITDNGGTIMKQAEVTDLNFESGTLKSVKINNDEIIEGKSFISNIHPKTLLKISSHAPFRPAFKKRLLSIEDTYGIFSMYMAMKDKSFEYLNNNFYVFKTDNVWEGLGYKQKNWPRGYMMHITPKPGDDRYTDAIIINTYMKWSDVERWENTTVEKRGDDYKEFKKQKAEQLLDVIEQDFPGIKSKIKAYYTSTPLTYRDYIGTYKGSIYGLLKDYNDPLRTMLLPRTSIKNLYFTGQNINVHGVIGVTICSVMTCSEFIGSKYLLQKMSEA
jgi:all-trans-retinol 13,14-reductase